MSFFKNFTNGLFDDLDEAEEPTKEEPEKEENDLDNFFGGANENNSEEENNELNDIVDDEVSEIAESETDDELFAETEEIEDTFEESELITDENSEVITTEEIEEDINETLDEQEASINENSIEDKSSINVSAPKFEEEKTEPVNEFNEFDNFEPVAKIKVIGVGGAGNNAVNRMINDDIGNVEFYVMNTDKQALSASKARNRLVLGRDTFRGLGAGGDPRIGKAAAEQSEEEIRAVVKGADMVFIAAGMGGGTGTGASPIIARIAREEGCLTVAIVTRPFTFEGRKRTAQAVEGLQELREHVDSIIVVSNDKLLMMNGASALGSAFAESDKVLAQSVKTVADLILMPAIINLDFADVRSTLKDSGVALIGFGTGSGPNKVQEAATSAISSPLLEASIKGAKSAIISVTCGPNVSLFEAQEVTQEVTEAAGYNLDIKFGVMVNQELGDDEMLVSVIATDFDNEYDFSNISPVQINRAKPASDELEETPNEEKNEREDILPHFLKGRNKI